MADWDVRASSQLEIVNRDSWDGDEALERVLDFYRDDEGKVDARKAPKGFLLYDTESNGNNEEDYKFPFSDIVDGEHVAVTRGIEVADSYLNDADVGEELREEMESVINQYRKRSEDLEGPEGEEEDGKNDDTSNGPYIVPMGSDTREAMENGESVEGTPFAESINDILTPSKEYGKEESELPYEVSKSFGTATIKDVDLKTRTVTGYFASFLTLDSDGDRFDPGAFDETVAEWGPNADHQRIKHLYQHDVRGLLGKPDVLKADEKGLYFETPIINTQLGTDVLKMYQADLLEHSVGFVRMGEELLDDDSYLITKAKLFEGSAVTWGANPDTPFEGFKSIDSFTNYIQQKVSALRSLLSEGLHDVRMEQIELGLRQLEADLQKLDQMKSGGDDEKEVGDETLEGIEWPPSVDFFATESSEGSESHSTSFF